MKLSTKLTLGFALLSLLSTSVLTLYATKQLSLHYVQSELAKQRQVQSLLLNNISGVYYNYLNQQILAATATRTELTYKARLLTNSASDLLLTEANLMDFFRRQQRSLQELNNDLVIMKADELALPPLQPAALSARSIGGDNLLNSMRASFHNRRNSYYLSLYQDNSPGNILTGGNFISYIFLMPTYPQYVFALLQNIDDLMHAYSQDDGVMLDLLKSSFNDLSLFNQGQGIALTADATSGQIRLTTNQKPQFDSIPQALSSRLTPLLSPHRDIEQFEFEFENYYICADYYRPLNWYILTLQDKAAVLKPAARMAAGSVCIGLAILLVSVICALFTARHLTKRLSQIAAQANQLNLQALQDPAQLSALTASLQLQGQDEVTDLGKTIARIGGALSQNLAQLMQATQQSERLQGELNAARQIQEGMLPPPGSLPAEPCFDCAGFLEPAKEVGGDFYDAFYLNEDHCKAAVIIGDVSDKGVPAALFMSMTLSLVKSALALGFSPAHCLNEVNQQLASRNPNLMFVTLYCAVFDLKSGKFEAVNAGHCQPLVCTAGGVHALTEISGPAVGPFEDIRYSTYQGELPAGSCLLLYTDGVTEAQDQDLKLFGSERLQDLAASQHFYRQKPADVISGILQSIADFRKEAAQSDDLTLLCVRRD